MARFSNILKEVIFRTVRCFQQKIQHYLLLYAQQSTDSRTSALPLRCHQGHIHSTLTSVGGKTRNGEGATFNPYDNDLYEFISLAVSRLAVSLITEDPQTRLQASKSVRQARMTSTTNPFLKGSLQGHKIYLYLSDKKREEKQDECYHCRK
jgi:hypothetical protein